jgi:hypothetical protein
MKTISEKTECRGSCNCQDVLLWTWVDLGIFVLKRGQNIGKGILKGTGCPGEVMEDQRGQP